MGFPGKNIFQSNLFGKLQQTVPGGVREATGGGFREVGINGWLWSSTSYGGGGYDWGFYFAYTTVRRLGETNGSYGLSVRCLRYLTGKFS